MLYEEEKEELFRRFEAVEREEVGEGVNEKYINLIKELEHRLS